MREYGVDLLDFYRGTMTVRRLAVLVKQLKPTSGLARILSGPVGAEMEAKAQAEAKLSRKRTLKVEFQKLKRRYGLG
ncbi:hypothetical protein [Mycolicibacterium sp. F2034L]|uniref:hypothetical protein n=1 Tax=Mycolicibacterium sp. F2034L TaxID=2926422 RepID=UPI001FF34C7C|nr:hypothetical protein [Mycolicibacterium sp. F2034L]MCK0174806.1 hypothetical protein [Mycolicibacterium sp. F2034L]